MTSYVAYGVRLDSDVILPGLPRSRGDEPTRVAVRPEEARAGRARPEGPADAEYLVDGRALSLHVNGDLEIEWQDVCRFRLDVGRSVIYCARGSDGTAEHLREWLLHDTLPLLLLGQTRLTFLHGSAVEIEGGAVGFLAASGEGKTTLAQYFVHRGHGFLSDEKLGIRARGEGFLAVPSTPFYRPTEANPRWRPAANFSALPMPLAALYVLCPGGRGTPAAIEPFAPGEASFALARRCEFHLPPRVRERLRLPPFERTRFESCTALAAAVHVSRLLVPRDLARLPDVYDAVLADVARVS